MMMTFDSMQEQEDEIDMTMLLKRYPRFCKFTAEHSRGGILPRPRQRETIWVLQLIERVYDERHRYEMEQGYRPGRDGDGGGDGADQKSASAKSPLVGKKRKQRPKASAQKLLKTKIPMSFPEAVHIYISKVLGLADLVEQACWDLLYSIETLSAEWVFRERGRKKERKKEGKEGRKKRRLIPILTRAPNHRWPEVELFGMFLRELYDTDVCLFFLHVRNIAQVEFGLALKQKDKQLDHFVISDKSIFLTADPRLPDKTQLIWFSEAACLLVAKRLFGKEGIAKFFLYTIEDKFISANDASARTMGLRDGGSSARLVAAAMRAAGKKAAAVHGIAGSLKIIRLPSLLRLIVEEFRNVEEDIVNQIKYNDDGQAVFMLTQLQETMAAQK